MRECGFSLIRIFPFKDRIRKESKILPWHILLSELLEKMLFFFHLSCVLTRTTNIYESDGIANRTIVTLFHYVKSVRIRSNSGLYFPAFGLNTERYPVSLRIQTERGKIRTWITPNTDTFHEVFLFE